MIIKILFYLEILICIFCFAFERLLLNQDLSFKSEFCLHSGVNGMWKGEENLLLDVISVLSIIILLTPYVMLLFFIHGAQLLT